MEKEISSIIGHELAALFFNTFYGCIVYFPAHMDGSHKLAMCLGLDAAKSLSKQLSKVTISVPTRHAARIAARNQSIKHDKTSGLSLNELAIKYQLTTRQLSTICKQTTTTGTTND